VSDSQTHTATAQEENSVYIGAIRSDGIRMVIGWWKGCGWLK
jgi:hypothetical protein